MPESPPRGCQDLTVARVRGPRARAHPSPSPRTLSRTLKQGPPAASRSGCQPLTRSLSGAHYRPCSVMRLIPRARAQAGLGAHVIEPANLRAWPAYPHPVIEPARAWPARAYPHCRIQVAPSGHPRYAVDPGPCTGRIQSDLKQSSRTKATRYSKVYMHWQNPILFETKLKD
jgi:hypothetical protein